MKKLLLLLITLALLVLGACGSPKITTPRIIEPEELISKEEAEEFIGLEVVGVEKAEEDRVGQKICFYKTEGDYRDDFYYLQISIIQKAFMIKEQTQTPEDIFRGTKELFSNAIDVEGVGNEAYAYNHGLAILSDGYYISISTSGSGLDTGVQELLIEVGKQAVENLDKIK